MVRVGGQELLEVGLHTVLHEARVGAELVVEVGHHILEGDGEGLALWVRDHPHGVVLHDGVGRVHPVEWLVGAAVGVDSHATIGFDHDEAQCHREMVIEAPSIVDAAAGDDQSHRRVPVSWWLTTTTITAVCDQPVGR